MSYEIFNENCFEWLKRQPACSIHAVCSDPPFGIVEFLPNELEKMRSGRGGVWRIPPSIGGSIRAPLPRFTTLSLDERKRVQEYFYEFGQLLFPVLAPGAHVVLAGTPMLQHLVQAGMSNAGFEVRGAIMRIYRGFRGGDRPKLAEEEFPEVCVTPRGNYEPWMIFRKQIQEKTVAQNLRKWGVGALRRLSIDQPLPDIIQSGKTPSMESSISDHPTMKPQHFMRIIARSLLPICDGVVLDPFCGSGSTIAACEILKYNSIGIEVDEKYFNALRNNIGILSSMYPDFLGDSIKLPGGISDQIDMAAEQISLFT